MPEMKILLSESSVDTYSNRGGSLGTKIDTSASCGSQLPPNPYFPSIASNNDGIVEMSIIRPLN